MAVRSILSVLVSYVTLAIAASTFTPARPPAIPLAVKSPYLTTWQFAGSDGGNGGYLAGQWPTFWNGAITGWAGLIRVDGDTYIWMGNPGINSTYTLPQVNQTAFEYTSTRSIFTQNVNNAVGITVTFLSPITPKDYVRASLISSYMNVEVYSLDGNTHDVQLYTDISAEWISGDRTAIAQWDYGVDTNASTSPSATTIGSDYPTVAATANGPASFVSTYTGWTEAVTHTVTQYFGQSETKVATVTAGAKRDLKIEADEQPTVYVTDIVTEYITTCPVGHTLTTSGSTTVLTSPSVVTTSITSRVTTSATSSASAKSTTASSVSSSAASSVSRTSTSTSASSSSSGSSSRVGSSSSSSAKSSSVSTSATSCSSSAVETSGIAYHRVYRQTQLAFSEVNDQTEYGYWYYMTANTSILTFESGQDVLVRGAFVNNGVLADTQDTDYRAINDDYPVFGFALDLGCVGTQNASGLFTINLNQQDAIQFEGANGNSSLPSLWYSYFGSDLNADSYFYNDYSTAVTTATTFDNQVATDSTAAGGDNYTTITTLAVRQAFGALQLVNTIDTPYLFLKEISSDGNVQTVDVIFPFHPIAIYTNPDLLKLMLEPLFINQESGYWPYMFSIHDLGDQYPNATGHNDGIDEMQPLEECGNMIIMSLAYAQRADDNAWLETHYDILKQWNEYLIEEALIPADQISTDDFAGALANQTNLAIKGIIGIEAMAQIANRTSHATDGANYTSIAHSYINQWYGLSNAAGAAVPHTTLNYNNDTTYSLLYNLFADRELGLGLVNDTVYTDQSAFYPTVADTYGVPLDTRHSYTKVDWEMFCASIAEDDTKEMFINKIANWINQTPTNEPFTDLYDAITGDYPDGIVFADRPVVGGEFALLALLSAPTSGTVVPT